MKMEIFDPALCCPTGVCGPDVDPELTRIASDVHTLKKQNIDVVRYNLAQEPEPFVQNKEVNQLMDKQGTDILPVTVVDSIVKKTGSYPSRKELSEWLEVDESLLVEKATPSKVDIRIQS